MKNAIAGSQWTVNDAPLSDMVLVHWVGGSYGNFFYRMMHQHVSGFPDIRDDFMFHKGNSHSVNHDAYISDINPAMLRDQDVVLRTFRDFDYEHIAIKKHQSVSLPVIPTRLINDVKLNVKISLRDSSLAAWSTIQNIIKIQDPCRYYDKVLVDNILSDEIDYDSALASLNKIISSTHKSWFRYTTRDNFFNIDVSAFFYQDTMIDMINDLAKRLGTSTKNMSTINEELDTFYKSQRHIDSLRRHLTMTWDQENPVDLILKAYHEDIDHQ